MHKFTNEKLPATFNHFFTAVAKINSRYTRNWTKPNQYFILVFHTLRNQRTIKCRCAKTWNAVLDDLKRVNFYHFKLKFKQYLITTRFFVFFCFFGSKSYRYPITLFETVYL